MTERGGRKPRALCKNGHEFAKVGFYMLSRKDGRSWRLCKLCAAMANKKYHGDVVRQIQVRALGETPKYKPDPLDPAVMLLRGEARKRGIDKWPEDLRTIDELLGAA